MYIQHLSLPLISLPLNACISVAIVSNCNYSLPPATHLTSHKIHTHPHTQTHPQTLTLSLSLSLCLSLSVSLSLSLSLSFSHTVLINVTHKLVVFFLIIIIIQSTEVQNPRRIFLERLQYPCLSHCKLVYPGRLERRKGESEPGRWALVGKEQEGL